MNPRSNSLWRGALAVAGALLLAAAAGASTIAVPNGTGGGTCGAGNANIYQFGGNCGSLVSITDTNAAYVQDNSPASEGTYRVRFYANFDGKGAAKQPAAPPFITEPVVDLSMAGGDAFDFFVGYDGSDPAPPAAGGNAIVRAELSQVGSGRRITFYTRLNSGSESSFFYDLVGKEVRGWRAIEINWAKATTATGSDGVLQAWVDGTQVGSQTNLVNGNQVVNMARWGAVAGIDAGTTGTFKLDDFVSQRTGYIGPAQPFSDNTNTASAFWPFVQSIWAGEIMPGCTTSTFCPTSNIRRDEMSKYIAIARYGTDVAPPACSGTVYGDVNANNPYCGYIEALTALGVLSGCGGGNYCPAAEVDRREMVVFILGVIIAPPTGCTGMFADVLPAGPHATFCPWIEAAATLGLTGGCGGGNYCPLSKTARDQMSVFLTQAFQIPTHVVGP